MKDPAFLFYSQDFFTGTATMSMEDKGKYITILCLMHQQGRMTEETICFLVGSVSVNLKSKFKIDENGFWYNERLEIESEKRAKFTESRRNNGIQGGRPKKTDKPNGKPKRNHMDKHMGNHMEDENENEIINISFIKVWELYDKKVGLKPKLEHKWMSLSDQDREDAIIHIAKYKLAQPDKQFRKNFETYLNNRAWEDELPMTIPQQQQQKMVFEPKIPTFKELYGNQ
jgi:hypothetical protein